MFIYIREGQEEIYVAYDVEVSIGAMLIFTSHVTYTVSRYVFLNLSNTTYVIANYVVTQ